MLYEVITLVLNKRSGNTSHRSCPDNEHWSISLFHISGFFCFNTCHRNYALVSELRPEVFVVCGDAYHCRIVGCIPQLRQEKIPGSLLSFLRGCLPEPGVGRRITSYNVCYTKLLRIKYILNILAMCGFDAMTLSLVVLGIFLFLTTVMA